MIRQVWCFVNGEKSSKLVVAADCRDTSVYLVHVICRDQRHVMEMVGYKLHAHLNLESTKWQSGW